MKPFTKLQFIELQERLKALRYRNLEMDYSYRKARLFDKYEEAKKAAKAYSERHKKSLKGDTVSSYVYVTNTGLGRKWGVKIERFFSNGTGVPDVEEGYLV